MIPAVPPKLRINPPLIGILTYAFSLTRITSPLTENSPRFALMSPFAGVCAAAIPPSAALLNAFTAATTLNPRFMVIINTLYNITAIKICQGFFAAEPIICVYIKNGFSRVNAVSKKSSSGDLNSFKIKLVKFFRNTLCYCRSQFVHSNTQCA